jgi:hypothetical protein
MELEELGVDMPEKPNVHFMKPHVEGTRCRCYSIRNFFVLGAEEAILEFDHSFRTNFVKGSSKLLKDDPEACLEDDLENWDQDQKPDCKMVPTSFLLADGAEKPWRVIPAGEGLAVNVSIKEVLDNLGSSIDGPSGLDSNGLCPGGECPPEYSLTPRPRVTGMVISMDTQFFSHVMTTAKGPAYDYITANYNPPYAIFTFSAEFAWTSRGANVVVTEDTESRREEYDTYRYGAKFKLLDPRGYISQFDVQTLLQQIVNFAVYASFPPVIMTVLVFYSLGKRSEIFQRGQRKIMSIEELYKSFAFQAMLADKQFKSIDEDNSGFVEAKEIVETMQEVLGPALERKAPGMPNEWYAGKINEFAERITGEFVQSETNETVKGISHAAFIRAATFHEALNLEDVVDKVINPHADLAPGAKYCTKRNKEKKSGVAPADAYKYA